MGLKSFAKTVLPAGAVDVLLLPPATAGAWVLRFLRRYGLCRTPLCRSALYKLGVFPLLEWYYDPMFNPRHIKRSLREDRKLDGIDFNTEYQLDLLKKFKYKDELLQVPRTGSELNEFYHQNEYFGPGDAEFYYNMLRSFKPRRVVEIGSGFSTLIARKALEANRKDDPGAHCEYTCIEPYEAAWLEKAGFRVLRQKAEDVAMGLFHSLSAGDFLFIDSSHIIRPQGDVLFEFLEVLPALENGVIVHIHDIFTPKDYLDKWIYEEIRFWNEQYLLEAFLSFNDSFKVIGALNYLKHHHPEELAAACPVLGEQMAEVEPASFWMVKVR
ncbi:MAG: class I SAM-dependent methyltransferase [Syntrophobacteraceae bacterium]